MIHFYLHYATFEGFIHNYEEYSRLRCDSSNIVEINDVSEELPFSLFRAKDTTIFNNIIYNII